jgi:flavin reductase (DIM6/NTAB) family NADH-FMN oxidoreductase RutF
LTPTQADKVNAPLIAECHANLECRLVEQRRRYDLFIFEVVKAHALARPQYPRTIHYRGGGMFMESGRSLNLRRMFRPGML